MMTDDYLRAINNNYETPFNIDKWSDKELEEALRNILDQDRQRSQSISRNTETCGHCGAVIPECRQTCPGCEAHMRGKKWKIDVFLRRDHPRRCVY